MATTRTPFFARIQTLLSQPRAVILLFCMVLIVVLTPSRAYSQDLLQRGRSLYENGQYPEAVTVLRQATQQSEQSGDLLRQSLALSNLSLVYQQQNQWGEAQTAINASLERLQKSPTATDRQKAQALEVRGQLSLSTGEAQQAVEDWQLATQLFETWGDLTASSRTRLHQSLALQQLGLYHEAFRTLQNPPLALKDVSLQVACLRSLGNTIRVIGVNDPLLTSDPSKKLQPSEIAHICTVNLRDNISPDYLDQARNLLEKARELVPDSLLRTEILLDLGNLKRDAFIRSLDAYDRVNTSDDRTNVSKHLQAAFESYKTVEQTTRSPLLLVQARLNHLSLSWEADRWLRAYKNAAFNELKQLITAQIEEPRLSPNQLAIDLAHLPSSHAVTQARLKLVQTLLAFPSQPDGELPAQEVQLIEQLLTDVQQQGNQSAQSYAWGYWGQLQENQKNWQKAYDFTDRALKMSEALKAAPNAYKWQWQQGRILGKMGNRTAAIAAYETALKTLDTLRRDLLGLGNPDLQFSFRDRVEPVYRELVELLVEAEKKDEKILNKAPEILKELQIAELENYLRCRFPASAHKNLRQIHDSKAAIVYSMMLKDRIDLILEIPQEPLQYYRGQSAGKNGIEETIEQFKKDIGDNAEGGKLAEDEGQDSSFHRLYQWLLQPIDREIQNHQIKTVIFVPDGSLKSIPIVTLYDFNSKQYVVEKPYSIALSLGLPFSQKEPLKLETASILTAGISKAVRDTQALGFVEKELEEIQKLFQSRQIKKLLNPDFTAIAFKQKVVQESATIVHIATHGEFGSDPDRTFLVAWDKNINLNQLSQLIQARGGNQPNVIELLVLSACKTAAGDRRALLGMAGIAYRSGAINTIASMKSVNDQSTAELMKHFYTNLMQPGLTKAEALRDAQLQLKKQEEYSKPFYWGTFVLIGNGN